MHLSVGAVILSVLIAQSLTHAFYVEFYVNNENGLGYLSNVTRVLQVASGGDRCVIQSCIITP